MAGAEGVREQAVGARSEGAEGQGQGQAQAFD